MSINAVFKANFDSFVGEVQKAQLSLKTFETGASQVEKQLNKMGNSFSGQKVIQDANVMTAAIEKLGGTSGLTDKEMKKLGSTVNEAAQKMSRMGLEVPANFQKISAETAHLTAKQTDLIGVAKNLAGTLGLAFGAGAVISGVKNLINTTVDYASSLSDASVATGVSIAGLQRLEAIGGDAGVSMDALADSVNVLHRKLDDKAAIAAIEAMGLNYKTIRSLQPEQQFLEIAKSVGAIHDPVEKANAGAALFGRKWDEISKAITGDIQGVIDSTKVMSDSQVQALDRAGDAWERFVRDRKRDITGFLGELVRAVEHAPNLSPIGLGLGAQRSFFDVPLPTVAESGGRRVNAGFVPEAPWAKAIKEEADKIEAHIKKAFEAAGKVAVALDAQAEDELVKFANTLTTLRSTSFQGNGQGPADLLHFIQGATQFKPNTGSGGFAGIGTGPATLGNKTFSTDSGSVFGGVTSGAAQSIVASLQGEGNVIQSAAGTIGSQLGANIVGKFGESITKTLGKTFGGAINAILPGLGSLAAPLIGFVGKLFGGSEESKKVSPLRDEFFKMSGGLEVLNPKVLKATGSLQLVDNIFKAKTANQYNAALSTLNGTMAAFEGQVADAGRGLQALGGKFENLTAISPELQSALDGAFNSQTVSGYLQALQGVNGVLDEQAAKQEKLEGLASKYGLSLAALGPQFAQGQIDKHSKELINDWTILSGLGGDNDAILKGMAKSFSDLAKDAKVTGSEIPEYLKGPLQKLIDMGLLVDDAGEKFKDLSGLKFGSSLEQHLADLQTTLGDLSKVLDNLPGALAGIPKDVTVAVHYKYDDYQVPPGADGAATGGLVTGLGIQHFAKGGVVLPFHPRGTDTVPAMLTPGEMVLTRSQQKAISSLVRGGADRAIVIHTHVDLDGREVGRSTEQYLSNAIRTRRKSEAA